jgi:hypothetical protein
MVDTFLFPKDRNIQRSNNLLDATIRDFSGGWNVIDNDLNLTTKFSKILRNMQRNEDGSNAVRHGTKLFADTSGYLDAIIACEYFSGSIICVGKNGKLVRIDSNGNIYEIWSDDWAANLVGAPAGWATGLTFASFAAFSGSLIVVNGINKPLIIDSNIQCQYLNDPSNGSNANVPITKYVQTHGRYLIMAGDPTAVDRIHISSTDTSGVWVGDDAPNDAVTLDLGSRVPSGESTIKGLGSFRDQLLIFFADSVLPGKLGVFTESDHTPTFTDSMEGHGSISHRVIQTIGEDVLFADQIGVSSINRALFTGAVRPERFSQLIDPEIQKDINNLTTTSALEDRTFSIFDSQARDYMLMIPNTDSIDTTTETRTFVFKKNETLKIEAWYEFKNWNWTAACRSALKRIFFSSGTEVFLYGTEQDPIRKDREGSEEMFDDDTVFTDYTGFNPVADAANSGVPIPFVWELPWSDAGQRFLTKSSRYINFDTLGDNKFTANMFIDNIYKDKTDFGEDWEEDTLKFDDSSGFDVDVLDPTLTLTFEGGDSPGFGADEFGDDYGGGRPTRLEQLYAWTSRYKIMKLRIFGDAIRALKFVSITMAYSVGSLRR